MDRSFIFVSALDDVVDERKNHEEPVYQYAPIHTCWVRIWNRREEEEDKGQCKKANGEDVDEVSPNAQVKLRGWKLFAAETLYKHTANASDVRGEKSCRGDGQDNVEGHVGLQIR